MGLPEIIQALARHRTDRLTRNEENMQQMNRRDVLKWSAFFAGSCLVLPAFVRGAGEKPKRVLFFTKSSSYEHSVVKRKGEEPGYAEKILIDLGKPRGFDVTASKDGSLFSDEYLNAFDAIVFYTCGDLMQAGKDKQPPMTAAGKQALLDAVYQGKPFVGIHCASDTFHGPEGEIDPYIAMLGGEFIVHGKQQESKSVVVDAKFPGSPRDDFKLVEEWYSLKNFANDLHVILAQQTEGMTGPMYQRPAYPGTWARMHGKGRVFYTSMGHREDVWANPMYQEMLMGALGWATGGREADVQANMDAATPGARTLAKKITPATQPGK